MWTAKVEQTKREPQEVGFREASDIIHALQNIMANARIEIPDLETPYCTLPNCTVALHDKSNIGAIITERRQQLEAVWHELSSMETLMNEMKDLYKQLVKKKKKIVGSLALHKGRASSVWCFPNEVLSQIFVHCLPVEIVDSSPLVPEVAPVLLTQVCRRWREVAVNLPSLWCRLCVEPEGESISYVTWLQRSRGHPLSLCVTGSFSTGNVSTEFLISLSPPQSFLWPYLKQVSSLHIYDCRTIAPLMQDLSSIQEIVISGKLEEVLLKEMVQSLMQWTSSTLRTLRFTKECSMMLENNNLHPFYPLLANLENFEITVCEPSFGPLFELGCNLSSLAIIPHDQFREIYPDNSYPGCGGPHTHTKLQSLCIFDSGSYWGYAPLPILLDALTLPNLCVLEVSRKDPEAYRNFRTWPHEEFKEFLMRSKCPLRRLVLCSKMGVEVADEHVAEYHALVPSLQEVIISPPMRRLRQR